MLGQVEPCGVSRSCPAAGNAARGCPSQQGKTARFRAFLFQSLRLTAQGSAGTVLTVQLPLSQCQIMPCFIIVLLTHRFCIGW